MSLDIIIYAVVAAILLFRLWSLLGQRNDDEIERPNPFVAPKPPEQPGSNTDLASDRKLSDAPLLLKQVSVAPTSLAGSLEQIHSLDPSFDEKKFLQGARQALVMIIENFSHDNLTSIERLLGPDVLPHFQAAISARQASGQKMDSKVLRVVDAETVSASTIGTLATITVRFISEQENILRDSSGQVIGGDVGKVEQVTDIWTFARDTQSTDPNWILVETHG